MQQADTVPFVEDPEWISIALAELQLFHLDYALLSLYQQRLVCRLAEHIQGVHEYREQMVAAW